MASKATHDQLCYAFLGYLNELQEGKGNELEIGTEELEGFEVTAQCLTQAIGAEYDKASPLALRVRGEKVSLADVFNAGIAALEIKASKSNKTSPESNKEIPTKEVNDVEKKPIESDPRFVKFIESLTKKGYFAGTNEKEYAMRYQKAVTAAEKKFKPTKTAEAKKAPVAQPSPEDKKNAEAIKGQANKLMAGGKHEEAIGLYTEAIGLDGTNPVYFVNRGVALYKIHKYEAASKDCNEAIGLDSTYAKAWMRLGQIQMAQEKLKEAIENIKKALSFSNNANTTRACEKLIHRATERLAQMESEKAEAKQTPAGLGGLEGLGNLGGLDLAGLMNNPMVQQMMNNMAAGSSGSGGQTAGEDMSGGSAVDREHPASNTVGGDGAGTAGGAPDLSGLLAGLGGGGGMPDLQGIANNPMFEGLRNDPKMRELADDVKANGMGAILKAMNDPEAMQKVMAMAGPLMGMMKNMEASFDSEGAPEDQEEPPELN